MMDQDPYAVITDDIFGDALSAALGCADEASCCHDHTIAGNMIQPENHNGTRMSLAQGKLFRIFNAQTNNGSCAATTSASASPCKSASSDLPMKYQTKKA